MNAKEFLTHVWPSTGPYCIARPFTDIEIASLPPDVRAATHRPFKQFAVDDIDTAVALALRLDRENHDVYFAVGALINKLVKQPKGHYGVSRKAENIRELRCYFLDLDVGTEPHKYPSQRAALEAIDKFCDDLNLPEPTLTSSGGGIHAYWTLKRAVPRDEWKQHAEALKALTIKHGLHNDVGIVADAARVLRVVGTHNHKQAIARPVRSLHTGADSLVRFHTASGARSTNILPALHGPPVIITTESNTNRYDDQEYDLVKLLSNCQALRYTATPENQTKEHVPERGWLALIQTVRLVRNGVKAVHHVSKDDPRYNEQNVNYRLAEWEQKKFRGPATCAQIQKAYAETLNVDHCVGCPSRDKITTPLQLAKYVQILPAVTVADETGEHEVPALPDGYVRTSRGIGVPFESKTGVKDILVFCPYDMYPMKVKYDEASKKQEHIEWNVHFPLQRQWDTINFPSTGRAQLGKTLADFLIFIPEHHLNAMHMFMNAYTNKLLKQEPADMAFNKLGWRGDNSFVLGTTLYKKDGTNEEHSMSAGLDNATHRGLRCAGSYDDWQRAIHIYSRSQCESYRAWFMSGYASTIYKFTGLVATVINAYGRTGVGKSTLMEVTGSIWGEPDALKIHGDIDSSTKAGAEGLVNAMNNLPVFMDETTMRESKSMAQLIFNYSGGKGKIRSTVHGGVRGDTATWSNFLMLNANNDEYERMAALYRESSQHIVRLIQIPFATSTVISKTEGDALRRAIHENYGYAGRIFIEFVVRNLPMVKKRIDYWMRETDRAVNAKPEERFWTGWVACVKVAYEICINLNIVPWLQPSVDFPWLHQQIGLMRHTVFQHAVFTNEVLAEFLDASIDGTLVLTAPGSGNIDNVKTAPRGELVVRRELDTGRTYIKRAAFSKYCSETGANPRRVLLEMGNRMIVLNDEARVTLGRGTQFETGNVRCIEIDDKALARLVTKRGKP